MGSRIYAGECSRWRDNIIGMICLETIGCYSGEIGSQWLSFGGLFLPRRGDFLALVANPASKAFLRQVSGALATSHLTHQTRYTADVLPRRVEFRSLVVLEGGFSGLDGHRYSAATLYLLSHTRTPRISSTSNG